MPWVAPIFRPRIRFGSNVKVNSRYYWSTCHLALLQHPDHLPAQAKQHEQRIKAIHIEVDWTEPAEKWKCLQEAFSVDASEFPMGIKM